VSSREITACFHFAVAAGQFPALDGLENVKTMVCVALTFKFNFIDTHFQAE
jgi:hypothetical protein